MNGVADVNYDGIGRYYSLDRFFLLHDLQTTLSL